jgi:hypothetical protein
MFVVRGDASAEEVAALVAVLSALRSAQADRPGDGRRPRSEWGSPERKLRPPLAAGPGGWRSSGLPH